MPERDRSAVGVDDLGVESEPAYARERLRRERLVDLDRAEVVGRPAGAGQRLLARRHRTEDHDVRRHAGGRSRDDARAGREVCRFTAASLATTIAAAPSDSCDDEPAVTMPSARKTVRSLPSRSSVVSGRGPSSKT